LKIGSCITAKTRVKYSGSEAAEHANALVEPYRGSCLESNTAVC